MARDGTRHLNKSPGTRYFEQIDSNVGGGTRIKIYAVDPIVHDTPFAVAAGQANEMRLLKERITRQIEIDRRKFNRFDSGGLGGGSDRRIKQDIVTLGHDAHLGVDIYSWRYRNDDPTRYVGVMAQDLLSRPDLAKAVHTAEDGEFQGFYAVDYAALGLQMTTEDQWHRNGMGALRLTAAAA